MSSSMTTNMMTPTRPRIMSEKITWAPKRNRSKSLDLIQPLILDEDDFHLAPKRLRYDDVDDKRTWAPKKKRSESVNFDEISDVLKEQVDDISLSLKDNIDAISLTLKEHIDTIIEGLKENINPNKTVNRKLFDDEE